MAHSELLLIVAVYDGEYAGDMASLANISVIEGCARYRNQRPWSNNVTHEQAVIDGFNKFMKAEADRRGQRYGYLSLDGQDQHVLADYVLTDESTFTLVEFKYTQSERREERRKDRSLMDVLAPSERPHG